MRRLAVCLVLAILCAAGSEAQQGAALQTAAAPTGVPQTARQALMEMFFSKTPGTFVKHLPEATRAALEKSGALAQLQQYSAMASQFQTQGQGQSLQTFETGSVMLVTEDSKTGEKVEMAVLNDTLRGDRDDIELSFQVYKNGQAQRTPFMPQMTFSMKQESRVWTLNEISLTLHLPLADPDLLKALTEKMKPQPNNAHVTFTSQASQSEPVMRPAGSDTMVVAAMRTIVTAEITYAKSYPATGFTCTLSNLDGFGGGEPNEHQAMLINSGLASGKRYGFVFTLSECTGTPATGFHLTAAPNGNSFGAKAFCADQSGGIRSSDDGNPATCFASGAPVQ
ncbi:MAG TPA: hypothetical protein VJ999_01185 [Candidatus Sulfotelmatobacter sp.]|nr:hypothetical protein [Candidatus Sulfotelmatobacter sp.]